MIAAKVWVLWWREHDGSGAGVRRSYENEERARADLEMLKEHAHVDYRLDEIPLIKERGY